MVSNNKASLYVILHILWQQSPHQISHFRFFFSYQNCHIMQKYNVQSNNLVKPNLYFNTLGSFTPYQTITLLNWKHSSCLATGCVRTEEESLHRSGCNVLATGFTKCTTYVRKCLAENSHQPSAAARQMHRHAGFLLNKIKGRKKLYRCADRDGKKSLPGSLPRSAPSNVNYQLRLQVN